MKKTQTRRSQRYNNNIATSHPSGGAVRPLKLAALTRVNPEYVDSTLGNKSGWATFDLRTGDATYRAITWGIKVTEVIAGVTTLIGSQRYVKLEMLSDYIEDVRLVINGTASRVLSQEEWNMRNAVKGIDFGPVFAAIACPGHGVYHDPDIEDALALGTKGMRSLRLELKLKPAFDADKMEVTVMPHTVDRAKPTGFTFVDERLNTTFTGSGIHTYYDLPVDDDTSDLWVQGEGISRVKFSVAGNVLFDMDKAEYDAYLISTGINPDAVGDSWFIDFHSEGEARSLAALDGVQSRARDERYKLEVTTTLASTPVEFVVTQCDIFSRIR